jgi:lipid A 3-O-deacylase
MDFGPPRMRPALSGLGVFRPPEALAWYLYAGAEGRAVAYDATLDGNRNGYWRIDRRDLVGEASTGLAIAWGPVRLDGSVVLQSRTFDEQARAPHAFTAINLTLAF